MVFRNDYFYRDPHVNNMIVHTEILYIFTRINMVHPLITHHLNKNIQTTGHDSNLLSYEINLSCRLI